MKLLSRVGLLGTPWTAAYQAPLSMGFFRQEYWSGLPLPSPGCFFFFLGKTQTHRNGLTRLKYFLCHISLNVNVDSESLFNAKHNVFSKSVLYIQVQCGLFYLPQVNKPHEGRSFIFYDSSYYPYYTEKVVITPYRLVKEN